VDGPPTLILWDVDRTLVTLDGVGRDMLAEVFLMLTGKSVSTMPEMSGRTDHYLVTSVLSGHDVPVTDELVSRFFAEMVFAAPRYREAMTRRGYAHAGAAAAVEAFARHPGVVQSLVTGNVRQIAEQKLAVFGLDTWIDFEVGGYGTEDGARATLVRRARQRAAAKYGPFDADRVVVIGDTAHDIAGAREAGVRSVGVATGIVSATELSRAGADLVLDDLTDTPVLVDFALR